MNKVKNGLVVFFTVAFLFLNPLHAEAAPEGLNDMEAALKGALSEIGLPKGDDRLFVLTNAGYGRIENQTTEGFIDIAYAVTGCTIGSRSLLLVHSPFDAPLWVSLYRRDTGSILFIRWTPEGIRKQRINAVPEVILTPAGWKEAAAGVIGPNLFSVVSISLAWSVNPSWTLLCAASFHNHLCPGLNVGYFAAMKLREILPLRGAERYIFVSAPSKCWADAMQVIYDTTPGKGGGYAYAISDKELEKYTQNGVAPILIALRVSKKEDRCDGVVLGFDWDRAFAATGVNRDDFHSTSGPLPVISRAKMSWKLAGAPIEKNISYIVELKRFSGKAALAGMIVKGDPYAAVWQK
jgi:formylmethanofuran dehydrogenase subunit E